jgi:hypothetical protein
MRLEAQHIVLELIHGFAKKCPRLYNLTSFDEE